ncbi:MAG: hypothetical protein JW743_12025 [Deltaproteobacteria bacterium]|nr:hypothetical protein [Deltaproteobacteria bacterium]MBN2845155.1 hypothetical protein [Deltaproteobacteria bacterium]
MEHNDIEKYGITASGKRELLKYLSGERLTRKEAMLAKCYECMNGYTDGKVDCQVESCPLYPYMPFGICKITKRRKLTPEERVEVGKRLKKARAIKKRVNQTEANIIESRARNPLLNVRISNEA